MKVDLNLSTAPTKRDENKRKVNVTVDNKLSLEEISDNFMDQVIELSRFYSRITLTDILM